MRIYLRKEDGKHSLYVDNDKLLQADKIYIDGILSEESEFLIAKKEGKHILYRFDEYSKVFYQLLQADNIYPDGLVKNDSVFLIAERDDKQIFCYYDKKSKSLVELFSAKEIPFSLLSKGIDSNLFAANTGNKKTLYLVSFSGRVAKQLFEKKEIYTFLSDRGYVFYTDERSLNEGYFCNVYDILKNPDKNGYFINKISNIVNMFNSDNGFSFENEKEKEKEKFVNNLTKLNKLEEIFKVNFKMEC